MSSFSEPDEIFTFLETGEEYVVDILVSYHDSSEVVRVYRECAAGQRKNGIDVPESIEPDNSEGRTG